MVPRLLLILALISPAVTVDVTVGKIDIDKSKIKQLFELQRQQSSFCAWFTEDHRSEQIETLAELITKTQNSEDYINLKANIAKRHSTANEDMEHEIKMENELTEAAINSLKAAALSIKEQLAHIDEKKLRTYSHSDSLPTLFELMKKSEQTLIDSRNDNINDIAKRLENIHAMIEDDKKKEILAFFKLPAAEAQVLRTAAKNLYYLSNIFNYSNTGALPVQHDMSQPDSVLAHLLSIDVGLLKSDATDLSGKICRLTLATEVENMRLFFYNGEWSRFEPQLNHRIEEETAFTNTKKVIDITAPKCTVVFDPSRLLYGTTEYQRVTVSATKFKKIDSILDKIKRSSTRAGEQAPTLDAVYFKNVYETTETDDKLRSLPHIYESKDMSSSAKNKITKCMLVLDDRAIPSLFLDISHSMFLI